MKPEQLRPCRSPYCECDFGKCTHPGCYDARHLPYPEDKPGKSRGDQVKKKARTKRAFSISLPPKKITV